MSTGVVRETVTVEKSPAYVPPEMFSTEFDSDIPSDQFSSSSKSSVSPGG